MQNTLSQLEKVLPQGLLVDSAWLQTRGWSRSQIAYYVKVGTLEKPGPGAYWRPSAGTDGDGLDWRTVVSSLQAAHPPLLTIGGWSALSEHGLCVRSASDEILLFGDRPPPYWALDLGGARLAFRRAKLFAPPPAAENTHFTTVRGLWVSTPERALLELIEAAPIGADLLSIDATFACLGGLSGERLSWLLERCRSVKVKRLTLWFADRHRHIWTAHLRREHIDLGSGKRVVAVGGRLDPTYQITVPREL